MNQRKCPACGSESFYTKDPEDQYNIFDFDLKEGKIIFKVEDTESNPPDIVEETETFCKRCAWHDNFRMLKQVS